MGIRARFPHAGWNCQWWPHKRFQTGGLARLAGRGAWGSDRVVVGGPGRNGSEAPSPGAGEVYGRLECGQGQRPGRGCQSFSFEKNRLLECELLFLSDIIISISVLAVLYAKTTLPLSRSLTSKFPIRTLTMHRDRPQHTAAQQIKKLILSHDVNSTFIIICLLNT